MLTGRPVTSGSHRAPQQHRKLSGKGEQVMTHTFEPEAITQPPRKSPAPVSGPVLFSRYAFPPNLHGYCGPPDHVAFFENGVAGNPDGELQAMAREFAGAWPILELIARSTNIADPLDRRVVEAYWVGSPRLEKVGMNALGHSMEDRFRQKTGMHYSQLSGEVLAGGVPHHSFVVFCIYPWTGLLGKDSRAKQALTVLDMCRIRWGKVVAVTGDQVIVESVHLSWDGRRLDYAAPSVETVVRSIDGVGLASPLETGDWVSMHWEWICDRLTERQVRTLRYYTDRHLKIINDAGSTGATMVLP